MVGAQPLEKPRLLHQPAQQGQSQQGNERHGKHHLQYVTAFEMSQFMGEDGFDLVCLEAFQQGVEKTMRLFFPKPLK